MALSTLFNDFPLLRYENHSPRHRRARPLLHSVFDSLEDQIGNTVGQVFRILPALTMELDDYESGNATKKRKIRASGKSTYEPKSKVCVSSKDNKFKVCLCLDAANYQPEEITVKVVNDKLAISAKHESKGKDVYEYSEMYRSFDLPDNVDPNSITSHLSISGQLTVEAPLKALPESTGRSIPIEIEGKAQQAVEPPKTTPTKEKQ